MSGGFYGPEGSGSSPFDEFLARLYGAGGQRRPAQRVDIMRLMSEPARELLGAAASHVAERGGTDVGTENLLWAAASLEPTRQRGGEPPQLTPGAKRALLDAHQISRSLGSTYIGPEHILFALAVNPESSAGRMLSATRVTPEALQAALAGGGPPGAGGPGGGRS